jgi:hypothetical protein
MSLPAIATGPAPAWGAPTLRVTRRPDLAALAEKVRQLQAARRGPLQRCPTGLAKLDAALGGGFARGCIHELLAPAEAAPARSLAFWAAARTVDGAANACAHSIRPTADTAVPHHQNTADTAVPHLKNLTGWHGRVGRERGEKGPSSHHPTNTRLAKWVLYIDSGGDFYPPAVVQLGLPLEQLLIIHTKRNADALWVCEQALRCQAVAAVLLPIPTIDAYVSRRLQLAAETGGGLGFLLRSDARGGHTFAATRLRIDPLPNRDPTPCFARGGAFVHSEPTADTAVPHLKDLAGWHDLVDHATRRIQVTLLKLRDGAPAEPFELVLPPAASWETIAAPRSPVLAPAPRSSPPASAS